MAAISVEHPHLLYNYTRLLFPIMGITMQQFLICFKVMAVEESMALNPQNWNTIYGLGLVLALPWWWMCRRGGASKQTGCLCDGGGGVGFCSIMACLEGGCRCWIFVCVQKPWLQFYMWGVKCKAMTWSAYKSLITAWLSLICIYIWHSMYTGAHTHTHTNKAQDHNLFFSVCYSSLV